jgi:hypothetical protein
MVERLGGVLHVPSYDFKCYTTSVAAGAGTISYQIPIRVSSLNAVYVVLRHAGSIGIFSSFSDIARTRGDMTSYRFRLGSRVIPQSAIITTDSAVEARVELMRASGSVSDASPRSCLSATQYTAVPPPGATQGGFAIGVNMQAFAASNALSDGASSRSELLVFEANLAAGSPAMRMDVYC